MLTPDELIDADVYTTIERAERRLIVVKYWIGLKRAFRVTPDEEMEVPLCVAKVQVAILKSLKARKDEKRRGKSGGRVD